MAKLAVMPHQDIISGFKGTIDFYIWMGIPVARRWPRSPGHRRAPLVEEQWPDFTTATQIWNQLDEHTQQAFNETAHGTNLTGRDLSMKAYLSGYITS